MCLIFCLTVCLVNVVLTAAANNGQYTVIAPGRIYSNEIYTAVVAVHHTNQPCKINVGISGPAFNEMQQVEVSQYQVKTLDFNVTNLKEGDYSLTAESINCLDNFKNSTDIISSETNSEVIIQTDKGLYRPGDEIHFRVLFVDEELGPGEPLGNVMIWFADADYKIVKEIRNIKTVMGVYTDKFKIPKTSATGVWALGVLSGEYHESTVEFVVEDKYLVEVEATEAVAIEDGNLQVFVTANHVCGEPVSGKVGIEISLDIGYQQTPPPVLSETAHMVDGKAEFHLNVKDAFSPYTHRYRVEMEIVASVEDLTGVAVSQTIRRYIYPFSYTLSCSRETDTLKDESCLSFEGGKENKMLLQMLHVNGSFVEDTVSDVEFSIKEVVRKDYRYTGPVRYKIPPLSENHTVVFTGHLNATGFVSFNALLHKLPEYEGYLHYYQLKYKFLNEARVVFYTYEKRKPTKYFTLADQASSDELLSFNREYSLTIKSSEPLAYFVYNIVGQRNIAQSEFVRLSQKPKTYNLKIIPQRSWGRQFHVYVYYVDENGEFHYDEKRYQVHVDPNVIMSAESHSLVAGEKARITIKTNPGSFVGLMAVDQRMLVRKRNNDFTPALLDTIYKNFATFTPSQGGYSRYPGATSGCVTLTNGDYLYSWEPLEKKLNVNNYEEGLVPRKSALEVAISSVAAGENKCNVLAFENFESTEDGEIVFFKKVPDIETTWVFTAFAVNPLDGLSVAEKATEITVSKPNNK